MPQGTALSCSSAKLVISDAHLTLMIKKIFKRAVPYEYDVCSDELLATLKTGSSGFAGLIYLNCSTVSLVGEICRWNKTSFA